MYCVYIIGLSLCVFVLFFFFVALEEIQFENFQHKKSAENKYENLSNLYKFEDIVMKITMKKKKKNKQIKNSRKNNNNNNDRWLMVYSIHGRDWCACAGCVCVFS